MNISVSHILGGDSSLKLAVGLIISAGSMDVSHGLKDYTDFREVYFDSVNSRYRLSIFQMRYIGMSGIPVKTYVRNAKCCRKSYMLFNVIDYEHKGPINFQEIYGVRMKNTSVSKLNLDFYLVILLVALLCLVFILLILLLNIWHMDISAMLKVPWIREYRLRKLLLRGSYIALCII